MNIYTGTLRIHDKPIISIFKTKAVFICEDVENTLSGIFKEKINVQNVALFYSFTNKFKLLSLSELSFSFMERWFSMVADTLNFVELDLFLVRKILSSCELHVSSELEVYNAANRWLKHKIKKRRRFARLFC